MTEHKDYWRERFARLEKAQNQNGATYQKRVAKEYDKAIKAIEKDVGEWYARFATTEGITLAEAKKKLSKRQLKAFRMSVEEYVEKGESLDPKWAEELERASVKFHVSRLEALKLQLQQEAERVSGDFSKSFDDFARNTYSEHYYRTAYEIQKGLKLGWDVMRLDRTKIDKVVRKPWASDGRNFSERVWANRSKLVNELHTTLTQQVIRGSDPQKAINALSKRMEVSKHAAGRLIMTENAFFASAAEKDVFEALDVERYEILATLDSHTSQICRDMDGKVFKQSEFEVGVTAPPFHVYCRSTTVPYFDDEFTEGETRAARDKDGKYYEVPANMSYRDWEKTFVNGGSKEGLKPATVEKLVESVLVINEASQIYQSYGKEHYLKMHETLEANASEDQKIIWARYENDLVANNIAWNKGAYFSSREGGIKIDLAKDSKGSYWKLPYQTSFHEFGHMIDYLANGKDRWTYYSTAYKDGLFPKTIYEEVEGKISELNKTLSAEFKAAEKKGDWLLEKGIITSKWDVDYYNKTTPKWAKRYAYKLFEKELLNIAIVNRSALSDIVEGVTKCNVQAGVGHGKAYWASRPDGVEKEAFAEFWECVANPEQWKTIKKFLPKSAAVFEEMIKELTKNG